MRSNKWLSEVTSLEAREDALIAFQPPIEPMTTLQFPAGSSGLLLMVRHVQDAYGRAGTQARQDIEQRVRHLSHQVEATLAPIADALYEVEAVRCSHAVLRALELSGGRFLHLLKKEIDNFDWSVIWGGVLDATKEVLMYVGSGAVIGGAVGAFVGGVGAVPGALLGARIGAEILAFVGLVSLVEYRGDTIHMVVQTAAQGFATAWSAGHLPPDAHGKYAAQVNAAAESFAQCGIPPSVRTLPLGAF